MNEPRSRRLAAYGVAVLATVVSLLVRVYLLNPVMDVRALYITFCPAVLIAAYFGGFWPGLLATILSAVSVDYLFVEPRYSFWIDTTHDALALTFFVLVGLFISALSESLHRSQPRIVANERRYSVTLSSIGDAVIATDTQARVTFLNPVAEELTGWSRVDATGQPLAEVFRIVNEQTRHPVEDPAAKVLRLGTVVGLANHTVLLARHGREIPIDDSGAPIIGDGGGIIGVVLVFRDTTERRESEKRFRTFVDHATDAFFLLDERSLVLDVNRQACTSLGFTRDELLGVTPFGFDLDLIPAELEERDRKLNAGQTIAFESRHRRKDGTFFPVEVRGQAFREGGRRFTVALVRDITERKQAEDALRESESRFRGTFENAAVGIAHTDAVAVGRFLRVNEKFCSIVGYSREELLQKSFQDITYSDDQKASLDSLMALIRGESSGFRLEKRYLHKDGSFVWVEMFVSLQRDAAGKPEYAIAMLQDISERRRLEEELRESERRWRDLTEALPQLVWTARPDGYMDYSSAQVVQYMGRPESELLGWGWLDFLHPDDRERTQHAWQTAIGGQNGYEIEHRFRRFDGVYRWFKTRGVAILDSEDNVYKWFGTSTDITKEKQLEEELRQANERLELAVRGSNLAIWEVEMPDGILEYGRVTLINAWESLGYDPAKAPTDFADVFNLAVHPEDQARVGRAIQACLVGDTREFDAEYRILHKDGSELWHLTRGTVLRNPNGRPIRFIGSRVDITDLKRAEVALRESEQRFRTFVDHATDAFFLFDEEFVVLDVNRQACESLGYTRDELLGMTPLDFDPDVTSAHLDEIKRQLDDEQLMAFESRHRRKDGTVFPVDIRGQAFWEGGRRFFVSLARDNTDRKRVEEVLRESEERFRGTFENAGVGIAHCDLQGRFLRVNQKYCEIVGYSRTEMLTRTFQEVTHPEDLATSLEKFIPLKRGDCSSYSEEKRLICKDGSVVWINISVSLQHDAVGSPVHTIAVIQDISERKRLAEDLLASEQRFQTFVDHATDAFFLFDDENVVLDVNRQACLSLGYTRDELLGTTPTHFDPDVTPADVLQEITSATKLRRRRTDRAFESRHRRKDGTVVSSVEVRGQGVLGRWPTLL